MSGVFPLVARDVLADFRLPWASMAFAIIAIGPGWLSIDHLLDWWRGTHSR